MVAVNIKPCKRKGRGRICGNEDCEPCIARSFAGFDDVRKVAAWSLRNDKQPHEVAISSHDKCWFDCGACGHEFDIVLHNATSRRRSWCPYCVNQRNCGNADCESCVARSFAAFDDPIKIAAWSTRNDKRPHEVAISSVKKFWFNCSCGHAFAACLGNVTSRQRCWCPFCSGNEICGNEDCESCVARSFAAFDDPIKIAAWSARNDRRPHEVAISSNEKVSFDCSCGHDFDIRMFSVTGKRRMWCPYCANQRNCGNAHCESCIARSFAAFDDPIKIAAWSARNDKHPHEISMCSNERFWFNCLCGKEFEARLHNVTGKQRCWCPHCAALRNKGMEALLAALRVLAPSAVVITEDRIECEGRRLRIDTRVTHNAREFYVESDGPQHFSNEGMLLVQKKKGTTDPDKLAAVKAAFADQLDRDRLKERTLREAGKLLFRFSYRQHGEMDRLVADMIAKAALPRAGGETVYMDPELYAPLINFNI